jgi:regulatory protein
MRYPQRKSKISERINDTHDGNEDIQPPKPAPTGTRLRGLAFAMLGRREHSEQELKQKLLDLEADPVEVEAIINEFKSERYQSDQRMAEMIVRANVRKGRGPARVKQTLRERHVAQELAQNDLEETNWLALARELRTRKFGADLPTDMKEKARQLRFLQYRGFDGQTCSKAVMNHEVDE